MSAAAQLPLGDEPRAKGKAQPSMSSSELLGRLRRHYLKPGPFPGGIFVAEVGQNSGPNSRRCDALHVGFTATSGRILRGHELKVSRSDWLAELKQVDKASTWADECHEWWVVAPSTEVVHPEELPPEWGLLVPGVSKTAMVAKVKARTHYDRVPSWWAVRSLLARHDTLSVREVHERAEAEVARRLADREQHERVQAVRSQSRHEKLANALEAELGEYLGYNQPEDVARAVGRLVADEKQAHYARGAISQAERDLRFAIQHLQSSLTELQKHNREDTPA